MEFTKKSKAEASIPTASLPDIIFMLLIFFMVVTVFKEFRGLPILTPSARTTEKLETKRNVAYIWVDKLGRISIDDKLVTVGEIEKIMADKLAEFLVRIQVRSEASRWIRMSRWGR